MKQVLITGGAGFIGSHLTEFFLSKSCQVWIIDNLSTGTRKNIERFSYTPQFHFIQADVCEQGWQKKLPSVGFNFIYHLASPASPLQYGRYPLETLRVNSYGTYNVLEYAHLTHSKSFVYASTSEVYGDPLTHPQKETYWGNVNPVGSRSCYDEGKRFGEALCVNYARAHLLDVRIARIFNTYGPYMEQDDGRVISNFLTQALSGKPLTIYGDGNQTRSFCYVKDMIQGLYLMGTEQVKGQVINLGNPNEKKIIDIARLILSLTQSRSEIVHVSLPEDDPKKRKPDTQKAQQLLGFKPKVSLSNGLILTQKYFSQILSV